MLEERLKWREAYMPECKLHFFCHDMYSSSCFDLWILVSNAHLMVKLLPIQLERFVLSKWHVLLYCIVHYIGCRIGSGCKKWYLIINFSHVRVWWHIQVLWWWMELQLSITTSTNMSDLFQLSKLQESLKHDYILFIELGPVCVPLNPAWSTSFFIQNSIFLS